VLFVLAQELRPRSDNSIEVNNNNNNNNKIKVKPSTRRFLRNPQA